MTEHHKSCKPYDKSLVWHCVQCGTNEPVDLSDLQKKFDWMILTEKQFYNFPGEVQISKEEAEFREAMAAFLLEAI